VTIRKFAVRYGEITYRHDGEAPASPSVFHDALVLNEGREVPWGNGTSSTVDPGDPDSAYHFLVDGIFEHKMPDEVIDLVDDSPIDSGVRF
jgi:hypothetical protein